MKDLKVKRCWARWVPYSLTSTLWERDTQQRKGLSGGKEEWVHYKQRNQLPQAERTRFRMGPDPLRKYVPSNHLAFDFCPFRYFCPKLQVCSSLLHPQPLKTAGSPHLSVFICAWAQGCASLAVVRTKPIVQKAFVTAAATLSDRSRLHLLWPIGSHVTFNGSNKDPWSTLN